MKNKLPIRIFTWLFNHKTILILIILLEISFLIRIRSFNAVPFYIDESSRDYLIARHIYDYQDFPLLGPTDMGDNYLRNNPFYFYFLSSFLFIKDSLFFLENINIFLQLINIIIIYFLAKRIFGTGTGLLAATIFSIADCFINQSNHLWQPYIMQPFINLSYLLIVIGYQKKKIYLLILSLIIYLLAASIHRSTLTQLPLFLITILAILKSWKVNKIVYLYPIITFVFLSILLYFPVLYTNGYNLNHQPTGLNFTFYNFTFYLFGNFFLFTNTIFPGGKLFNNQLFYLFLISSLSILFLSAFRTNVKIFTILAISILTQFGAVSISSLGGYPDSVRYFTPIFGLFIIFLSAIIIKVGRDNIFHKVLCFILIFITIYLTSPNFLNKINAALAISKKPDVTSIKAVANEISEINQAQNYSDYRFFRIVTYKYLGNYSVLEAIFYPELEKIFNQSFITVKDTGENPNFISNGFTQTNEDSYYFIVCYEFPKEEITKSCLGNFLSNYKTYEIQNFLHIDNLSRMSVYLAKKVI
jgi:hypothetical protein